MYKLAILKGDGIGPEIIDATLGVLEKAAEVFDFDYELEEGSIGAASIDKYGEPVTDETLKLCKKADAILFGAIGDPKYDNAPDLKIRPEQGLLKLRKELGLYANIRPVSANDHLLEMSPLKETVIKGADLVIYRELTGGIYFGKKGMDGDKAYDHCVYTEKEIDRILHLSFKAAQQRRKKLTLVDKANVLETSRLWRRRAKMMAKQYPEVLLDFLYVDNAAMQLVLNPGQFDVVVTENMFGDILSDEASVITGSIGLLASASIGLETGLFEPIHGSFPQATGLNEANPIASILSLSMLLDYLNEHSAASAIREAVDVSFKEGAVTKDLSDESPLGTTQVAKFIEQQLSQVYAKS